MITEYDPYVGKCGKFRLQKYFLKNGGLLPDIKTKIIDDYDDILMRDEFGRIDIGQIKLEGSIILFCIAEGLSGIFNYQYARGKE